MATKKCPKCGEENPAEAVMCWACYTPLAGGAAAAAGGGLVTPRGGAAAVTPAATAAAQDAEKTPVDPKIFVIVGLLIAAAVIGSFTTGLIGGPGGGPGVPDVTPIGNGDANGGTTGGGTTGPQQTIVVAPPQPPTGPAPPTPPGQDPPQMRILVPPDPRQTVGTMGVVVSTPNISPAQALSYAKVAKQQVERGGRWSGMQVLVFNNLQAAVTFRRYQAERKGQGLTPAQYQELENLGVWSSVPAYYETRGKNAMPYYPASNRRGWWTRRN